MKHVVKQHALDTGEVKRAVKAVLKHNRHLRTDATTGEEFIRLDMPELENQWNGMIEFSRGRHDRMTAEAGRACEEAVKAAFKVTPLVRMEEAHNTQFRQQVRRVDFACELAKRACTSGEEYFDLDVDAALAVIVDGMRFIGAATDADEAHNEFWSVNAIASVLANHGIECDARSLWFEANPPAVRALAIDELNRYKAWDGKWKPRVDLALVSASESFEVYYDDFGRFMACERAGDPRRPARAIEPAADWVPEVSVYEEEGAEAPSEG